MNYYEYLYNQLAINTEKVIPGMNVTLRQLRAFVAVAELGRFKLAAERLCLTPSAISVLVKELEEQLGEQLLNRHTRKVNLTTVGVEFLPIIKKVLSELETGIENIHDLSALKRGQVNVASAIVLSATMLPQIVANFKKEYPQLKVNLLDVAEEELRPLLTRGDVEICVGTSVDVEEDIEETLLLSDRLMFFCREDHRFANRKKIKWKDLAGEQFISFLKDNPLRELVDRALYSASIPVTRSYNVRFSTTVLSMIAEGLGVAILPENSRDLTAREGVVAIDLIDPVVTRDVSVSSHRFRALSPAAQHFKDVLLEMAR